MDEQIKNEINESFKKIHESLDKLKQGFKEDLKSLNQLNEEYKKTRRPITINKGKIQ